ncbi:hypothetical protein A2U01_0031575, partial [Trifolium medium]|nr:hypothetical protein [Trifolium medium]
GFEKPSRVLLDYNHHTNEFAITFIAAIDTVETIDLPDRPSTFETLISPNENKIIIPLQFYQLWKRQLHRHNYSRITTLHGSAGVHFGMDDNKVFMFYGQDVAQAFGFHKQTKVLLQYHTRLNEFAMTIIPEVDPCETDNHPNIIVNPSISDESHAGTDILDEADDDEADDHEEENGEQPLEIHTWNKIVTRAMANLRK